MAKLKNILYICSHIPDKNAVEAGHKIAWYNLKKISSNVNVFAVFIHNNYEQINFDGLSFLDKNKIFMVSHSKFDKLINYLFNLKIPPKFASRVSSKTKNLIKKIINEHKIEKIYYDFEESAIFSLICDIDLPSTVFTYDVLTQWWLRSSTFYSLFAANTFRYEQKILKKMNEIYVYSDKDKQLISSLFGIHNVKALKPRLSDFVYSVNKKKTKKPNKSILFWGALNRKENEDAVLFFTRIILIKQQHFPRCT